MSLPKEYKQAVFKKEEAPLTIEDVKLTQSSNGEISVKVEACGECYSDMFAQKNIMGSGFPIVPGHEITGKVVAVGDEASAWKVGDRTGGAWHGGHDGTCKACKKGFFQMCDNGVVNGEMKAGGYAEYCKLRTEAAVRVPAHVDAAKYAPILCAGATVFNSMRKMNLPPGVSVGIQGFGGLGHLEIQYANKFGYRVVALSRDSKKEESARQLVAHEYIDASKTDTGEALQKLGEMSLIVATAPSVDAITPLLKGLGILGQLLILSVPADIPVNTGVLLRYGLSVHSWPSGHVTDSEEAIEVTDSEDINCMVERFPLARANDAFDAMMQGTVRFRAVTTMD